MDMFCPRCGSTYLEKTHSEAFQFERTETFLCHACGATFKLALYANEDGKRFTIKCNDLAKEDLNMRETRDAATDFLSYATNSGKYRGLASDYFGDSYDCMERNWYNDPEGCGYNMGDIDSIIPAAEFGYISNSGYIDGMDVGDEVRLPDTDLVIVRTKNSKARLGRRSSKHRFGRR